MQFSKRAKHPGITKRFQSIKKVLSFSLIEVDPVIFFWRKCQNKKNPRLLYSQLVILLKRGRGEGQNCPTAKVIISWVFLNKWCNFMWRNCSPPPFFWVRYGNLHTLPSPTAYPIRDRRNSALLSQDSRSSPTCRNTFNAYSIIYIWRVSQQIYEHLYMYVQCTFS